MPQAQTTHFGLLEFAEHALIEFPFGIPAFEDQKQFIIVEDDKTKPIIFLQSMSQPDLVFMALPARAIEPNYDLQLTPEDLIDLDLDPNKTPHEGNEILTLALVTVWENRGATVNLMAPIVINAKTRRAVQVIQASSRYSHRHPLGQRHPEPVTEAVAV